MADGQRAEAIGGDSAGKNSYQNKLKKRKKKFLANVKGFGKQGSFGRGTHLESDEWNYYVNILDAMRRGFESLEDKSKYIHKISFLLTTNSILCVCVFVVVFF